jgi:ABC-type nickel/cobalt efflux system permease component RcnA
MLFIALVVYAVSTALVLTLVSGMVSRIPRAYLNPQVCIIYAVISFVLTALTGAYHLSTMLRRKKRKTDHLDVLCDCYAEEPSSAL